MLAVFASVPFTHVRSCLRWSRVLSALFAAMVATLLGVSLVIALFSAPLGGLEVDSNYDMLRAVEVQEGHFLPMRGSTSWNFGTFHPGPLLYWVMAAGVAASGTSAASASLGAAFMVLCVSVLAWVAVTALLAYRAGLAAALMQVAALVWLYQGNFPDSFPHPGTVWNPAVGASLAFLLALAWGLLRGGRWAFPLVAGLACAAAQVYLPLAPAAALVLGSVAVRAWGVRRSVHERKYLLLTGGVLALGLAFIPVRLVTEGLPSVVSSVLGSGSPGAFAFASRGVEALAAVMSPYPWLLIVPLVGVPLGWWAGRFSPLSWLLRPLGTVVLASGVLSLVLQVTIVASLNRPGLGPRDFYFAWPAQAATLAHVSMALGLLGLLGLRWLVSGMRTPAGSGSPARALGRSVGRSLTIGACVCLVPFTAVVLLVVSGAPVAPAPWSGAGGGSAIASAEELARRVAGYLPRDGSAFVTSLSGAASGYQPATAVAGFLALEAALGGEVCVHKDVIRRTASAVSGCRRSSVVTVVTVVDPSWTGADLPGGVIGEMGSPEGLLRVTLASPDEIALWLSRQPVDAAGHPVGSLAYCDVVACSADATLPPVVVTEGRAGCESGVPARLTRRGAAISVYPASVELPQGGALALSVDADAPTDLSLRLVAEVLSVPRGVSSWCLVFRPGEYEVVVLGAPEFSWPVRSIAALP